VTNQNTERSGRAFGSDLPWEQASGQIFRATGLKPLAVIDGENVRAVSPRMPFGVLRLACPALGDDLLMPLTHRDEFYAFAVLLSEDGGVPRSEEVLVAYLPPSGMMRLFSAAVPRLRIVIAPASQLEKLYRGRELVLTNEQLGALFTPPPRCWNCGAKVSAYMLRCRKCHVAVLQHPGPDTFRQLRRANKAK
jgi:hypothetical protein